MPTSVVTPRQPFWWNGCVLARKVQPLDALFVRRNAKPCNLANRESSKAMRDSADPLQHDPQHDPSLVTLVLHTLPAETMTKCKVKMFHKSIIQLYQGSRILCTCTTSPQHMGYRRMMFGTNDVPRTKDSVLRANGPTMGFQINGACLQI